MLNSFAMWLTPRRPISLLGLVLVIIVVGAKAQDFSKLSSRNYLTPFKRGWKEQHPLRHRGSHRNVMHDDPYKWFTGFGHSKMKRRHGGKLTPWVFCFFLFFTLFRGCFYCFWSCEGNISSYTCWWSRELIIFICLHVFMVVFVLFFLILHVIQVLFSSFMVL